jgi:hypothetical protein
MFLTWVWEASGSNLGRVTGYLDVLFVLLLVPSLREYRYSTSKQTTAVSFRIRTYFTFIHILPSHSSLYKLASWAASLNGLRMKSVHAFAIKEIWRTIQQTNEKVWGLSKSFRTCRLERELQIVQLSATRCSCIAILWVTRVSFAAITLCVASQRVTPKINLYFFIDSVRKLLDKPSYVGHLMAFYSYESVWNYSLNFVWKSVWVWIYSTVNAGFKPGS